jgi:hypothetical protein
VSSTGMDLLLHVFGNCSHTYHLSQNLPRWICSGWKLRWQRQKLSRILASTRSEGVDRGKICKWRIFLAINFFLPISFWVFKFINSILGLSRCDIVLKWIHSRATKHNIITRDSHIGTSGENTRGRFLGYNQANWSIATWHGLIHHTCHNYNTRW